MTARGVLLAVLVAGAPGLVGTAGAASLADRLPPTAQVVALVDLARIRQSPLLQASGMDLERLPGTAGEAEAWLAAAGVDPRRDLDEIAVAAWGEGPGPTAGEALAVLASGRFHREKVRAALLQRGAVARDLRAPAVANGSGLDVLVLPAAGGGEALHVTFLGPGLLGLGTASGLAALGDPRAAEGTGLREQARQLVPADAAFWIAADPRAGTSAAQAIPMASGLRSLVAWGRVSDALELRAAAEAPDAATALQLAGALQLVAGLAGQSTAGSGGDLTSVAGWVSGLRLLANGTRIEAELRLTKDQVASLRAGAGAPAGAGARGR